MDAPHDVGRARLARSAGAWTQRRRERSHTRELSRIGERSEQIVVGPWISEVGFELLYWIPMLRRLLADRMITPDRVTVITRGGAHAWYGDLAARHIELFDLMTPRELAERNAQRHADAATQKHLGLTELDAEILRRAGPALDDDAELVHPRLLYRGLRYLWGERTPLAAGLEQLRFRPLPDPGLAEIRRGLPERYVAVKAYFSPAFPATRANQAFVAGLVDRLAERIPVVGLAPALRVDDHDDVPLPTRDNVVLAHDVMTPRDNLRAQTAIVAGAERIVATYGGFSYLGPFLSVPSSSFWSEPCFNRVHLDVMHAASRALGTSFDAHHTARFAVPA